MANLIQWYVGRGDQWQGPYSREQLVEEVREGKLSWLDWGWNATIGLQWVRLCNLKDFIDHLPVQPPGKMIVQIREQEKAIKAANPEPTSSPYAQQQANPTLTRRMRETHGAPGTAPIEVKPFEGEVTHGSPEVPSGESANAKKFPWFLQFDGSEFGPLTVDEVTVVIKSGRLKGKLYCWRQDLEDWVLVDERPEFQALLKDAGLPIHEVQAQVQAQSQIQAVGKKRDERVHIVATVKFSAPGQLNESGLRHTGICRDISISGLKVISSRYPGSEGTAVLLEVSPMENTGLKAFTVQVEIVGIFPEQGAFSVRYLNLLPATEKALQAYVDKMKAKG